MCAERDMCATCAERDVKLSQRVEPRSGLDISRALNATHSISRSVRYVSVCAVLKIQAVQHNCWLDIWSRLSAGQSICEYVFNLVQHGCWLNIWSRLSAEQVVCEYVFNLVSCVRCKRTV